jgi:hypothetical protein
MFATKVWPLSIVQGPFSARLVRFAKTHRWSDSLKLTAEKELGWDLQVGLGLTDFDHAWYENYLVDVYHMAVSVALAAADANTPTSDLVRQFVESYLAAAQTSAEEAATREVTAATASSWVATRLRQVRCP